MIIPVLLLLVELSWQQLVAVRKVKDGSCTTFSGDQGNCVKEKDCDDVLKGR